MLFFYNIFIKNLLCYIMEFKDIKKNIEAKKKEIKKEKKIKFNEIFNIPKSKKKYNKK